MPTNAVASAALQLIRVDAPAKVLFPSYEFEMIRADTFGVCADVIYAEPRRDFTLCHEVDRAVSREGLAFPADHRIRSFCGGAPVPASIGNNEPICKPPMPAPRPSRHTIPLRACRLNQVTSLLAYSLFLLIKLTRPITLCPAASSAAVASTNDAPVVSTSSINMILCAVPATITVPSFR